jgi:hypothetical protein
MGKGTIARSSLSVPLARIAANQFISASLLMLPL